MIGNGKFNTRRRIALRAIQLLHVSVFLADIAHGQAVSPSPSPDSYGVYYSLDPSRAIVVAVLICVFFFIGFLSVYIRQCVNPPAGSGGPVLRPSGCSSCGGGLDPAIVESFPTFAYSAVKGLKIGKSVLECAICLSEFEDDDETLLRLLPRCCHVFHADCIDAWLFSHATCPVCRAKLTAESAELEKRRNYSLRQRGTGSSSDMSATAEHSHPPDANDQVVIDVEYGNDPTGDPESTGSRKPKRRSGITGRFHRSNSTGHSLAQLGGRAERYNLRLLEETRNRLTANGEIRRTRSYDSSRWFTLVGAVKGVNNKSACTPVTLTPLKTLALSCVHAKEEVTRVSCSSGRPPV